jgi:hypothetical protein
VLASIEQGQADKAFLDAFRKLTAMHVNMSANPAAHNFAPLAMIRGRFAGKLRKAELTDAMHRLLNAGRLAVEEYGPPSKRAARLIEHPQK